MRYTKDILKIKPIVVNKEKHRTEKMAHWGSNTVPDNYTSAKMSGKMPVPLRIQFREKSIYNK